VLNENEEQLEVMDWRAYKRMHKLIVTFKQLQQAQIRYIPREYNTKIHILATQGKIIGVKGYYFLIFKPP
jgi:hypothetical protein